jgi:hypothetical protein
MADGNARTDANHYASDSNLISSNTGSGQRFADRIERRIDQRP